MVFEGGFIPFLVCCSKEKPKTFVNKGFEPDSCSCENYFKDCFKPEYKKVKGPSAWKCVFQGVLVTSESDVEKPV